MNKPLAGILPPIATPFKKEELDLGALKANIKAWNATGLAGYLVVGSNGEAVYLDDAEQERAIAAVKEAAAPEMIVMAGTGRESTRATVAATKRAAAQGADCALVVTPHYFKGQMTNPRLAGHFQRVADESPIPILLYNVPQATGVNMGPEVVAELSSHGNIAGIKDSSGNIAQLSEIIHFSQDGFRVLVGNAEVLYPALCLGAVGGILAVANVLPSKCVELVTSFQAGDYERARRLQWEIAYPAALVTRIHGVGGLKAAMELAGYQGGVVRMPLTMPTPAVIEDLAAAFKPLLP
ncbi:MAG: dihydrodipicolinate synthase family protein [Thermodesulfobacteriota bacterium]